MNTDYRNSPQLNQEEKLLVRTMQRVRAGAGVVVLLVLVAGALFGPGERTSDRHPDHLVIIGEQQSQDGVGLRGVIHFPSVGIPPETDHGAFGAPGVNIHATPSGRRAQPRGIENVATAPPSGWLASRAEPPCNCATSRTKASPSPVPLRPPGRAVE